MMRTTATRFFTRAFFAGLLALAALAVATGCGGNGESCTPATEICDGLDNDCDGRTDTDAQGQALKQDCTTDCGPGTQTCSRGQWKSCAPTQADDETCDNLDNDCDGLTDKDSQGQPLEQACWSVCGEEGIEVCEAGVWADCSAPQPGTETCDGTDQDCDGEIDETFACRPGAREPCGSDLGLCSYGARVCDTGCQWGACAGGVEPQSAEQCDGAGDEDCDGSVDEGCPCGSGEQRDCCGADPIVCAGDEWPACPAPPAETCNGADDDCNGLTDDHLAADPVWKGEDLAGTEDCGDAAEVYSLLKERETGLTLGGYLYRPDLAEDRDFFHFRTREVDDLDCDIHPGYKECLTLTVTLQPPAGATYAMCLYDLGLKDSGKTCADPVEKTCTTTGSNKIIYKISGACSSDESFNYVLEVYPSTGTSGSCQPYSVTLDLEGTGARASPCV